MIRTSAVIAAVLVATTPAFADKELTLDEALQMAKAQNRDLKIARARFDEAAVNVKTAWAALLPTATAQARYTRNNVQATIDLGADTLAAQYGTLGVADLYGQTGHTPSPAVTAIANTLAQKYPASLVAPTQAQLDAELKPIVVQKANALDSTLAATVPLIVPSGIAGVVAAKRLRSAAAANYDVSETGTLFQVAQDYFAAAGADEVIAARNHAITVAQKTLDNANARLAAGVVNRVEVLRAQVAVLQAQQNLSDATAQHDSVYRALATILQLREAFHVVPVNVQPAPLSQEARNDALRLRPDYVAAERNVAGYQAQSWSQLLKWTPTISAFGNARFFNTTGFTGQMYAWAVGVEADWQIYDGGLRDAQRHLANAQIREWQQQESILRDTISDDIKNAEDQIATKRHAVQTAEQQVALSQRTLDLVRVQQDAGTATQLDLLVAQDTLVTSELSLAQSRFDYAVADLTLQRAAGQFPNAQLRYHGDRYDADH